MRMDLDVEDLASGLLDGMADRIEEPQPALRAVGDAFRAREKRVFATAAGGTWPLNDPATARRKGTARVLVDTGGLLRSLTQRGAKYHVERVTRDELLVGTRNPVAHLHRDGARGMPKRNPVPPTTSAEREEFASGLLDFVIDGQT